MIIKKIIATNKQEKLFDAIRRGNTKRVNELIELGVDLSIPNKYEQTPLSLAIKNKKWGVARALLAAGAVLNVGFHDKTTSCTTTNGKIEIASFLIEAGADLNATNEMGETPLHCAIKDKQSEVAKLLIEAGADLNVTNKTGKTPLYRAISGSMNDVATLLIEAGANPIIDTIDNNTHELTLLALAEAGLDKGFVTDEVLNLLKVVTKIYPFIKRNDVAKAILKDPSNAETMIQKYIQEHERNLTDKTMVPIMNHYLQTRLNTHLFVHPSLVRVACIRGTDLREIARTVLLVCDRLRRKAEVDSPDLAGAAADGDISNRSIELFMPKELWLYTLSFLSFSDLPMIEIKTSSEASGGAAGGGVSDGT